MSDYVKEIVLEIVRKFTNSIFYEFDKGWLIYLKKGEARRENLILHIKKEDNKIIASVPYRKSEDYKMILAILERYRIKLKEQGIIVKF